VTEDEVLIS